MADIMKCSNKECELAESCYRFTAKASSISQSYLYDPKKDCEDKKYQLYEKVS